MEEELFQMLEAVLCPYGAEMGRPCLTAWAALGQAQIRGPGSGGGMEPPNVGSWACPGGFGKQSRMGHGLDVL